MNYLDEGLDPDSDEEESKDKKRGSTSKQTQAVTTDLNPAIKEPPKLSKNIKFLLSQLEFNQIDLYR